MKIKTIQIANFKCIGTNPIKIDFTEDILTLIGENNVGKSAVLKALNFYFSGTKTLPKELFYNHQFDRPHAVIITIEFNSLSEQDKQHRAIIPYISNSDNEEVWILKKTYYYDEDGKGKCDYTAIVNGEEKPNPAGLTQNCDDLFTEEKMQKIFVEAVKDVSEVSEGNTNAVFGKIFEMILKSAVEGTEQHRTLINALRDYQTLFRGDTQLPQIKYLEKAINEKLCRIIKASGKIDTEPPKIEKVLPTPKLLTNDDREIDISPTEQGHGFQRALIFVLLELLAESTSPIDKEIGPRNLLLIEEPEIYMHPQMIRRIADTLYEIALQGKAQVICTTHSPIFIRIAEKQKALVRFVRNKDNSLNIFQQRDEIFSGLDKAEMKKQLQMIIDFDPTVNELFFAKRVVLLEGDAELAVFREAPNLLGIFSANSTNFYKRRDATLINCRGRDTIPLFQEVLNHFEIPYVVIHDTEGQDKTTGTNGKILSLLDNDESRRKVFDPDIETILGIANQRKDKPIKALLLIRDLHQRGELEDRISDYVKFAYDI